jgi:hypothetical protein
MIEARDGLAIFSTKEVQYESRMSEGIDGQSIARGCQFVPVKPDGLRTNLIGPLS